MPRPYSLIIFDWDGTLSNSVPRIVESMQMAISNNGLPARENHAIENIIGLGLPEALRILYPDIEDDAMESMRAAYSHQFSNGYDQPSPLFSGVEESLEKLLSAGFQLAVATGKSRRGMNRIFSQTDWHKYFHSIRCSDETRSKPHPLMLNEILNELQVQPLEALMVGDSEYDLAMAANAGMAGAAVSYGVHGLDRLRSHRPLYEVDSIAELADLLLK